MQQRQFGDFYLLEIDPGSCGGYCGWFQPVADPIPGDPSPVSQALQADKKRVPGKSRGSGIRRVSQAGRGKGQDLPQAQLGRKQKIHKLISFRTEVAYSVAGGQRSGMKKDSSQALK